VKAKKLLNTLADKKKTNFYIYNISTHKSKRFLKNKIFKKNKHNSLLYVIDYSNLLESDVLSKHRRRTLHLKLHNFTEYFFKDLKICAEVPIVQVQMSTKVLF